MGIWRGTAVPSASRAASRGPLSLETVARNCLEIKLGSVYEALQSLVHNLHIM